jgi:phosphoesterase RecJ-like protein
MNRDLSSAIADLFHRAQRILLVAHVAPDGDAIGSLLGLGSLLEAQGKEVTLACEDPVPDTYTWLPGSSQIARQGSGSHNLVVSLDCSDERRMGQVFDGELAAVPLLNIDHHITNTCFGTVNWVDPSSVSTTQMILALADALGWELTQPVAVCLLTGLVTDSRSFRTANVDDTALKAVLRLMAAGASLNEITHRVFDRRSLASTRLWGRAIDALHLEDGILWTEVTHAMRREWQLNDDGSSGLVNFLSGVREARVVVVFSERNNGTIDVSMRSEPGVDVAQVALKLGGGGHPQAAGCTLQGDLPQARKRVLAELRCSLAELSAESA